MAGLVTRDSKQHHCIRSGSTGLKYQALNKPLEGFWASVSHTAKRSKIKIKEGSAVESLPIFYSEGLKLKSRVEILPKSPSEGMGCSAGVEALPRILNGIPYRGAGHKDKQRSWNSLLKGGDLDQ